MTADAKDRKRSLAHASIHFVLTVLASMGLGLVTDLLLDRENFETLLKGQESALEAVNGFDPWKIAWRYGCALGGNAVVSGSPLRDCAYEGAAAPVVRPLGRDGPTLFDFGLGGAPNGPPPEPTVGHWARSFPTPLAPLVAFLDVAWHLVIHASAWGSIFALAQFVLGFGAVLAASSGSERSFWAYAVGYPLGIIFFGCLIGFGVKWLMVGGLFLFGRYIEIAGMCCGIGGMVHFGYKFFVKAAEKVADEAIGKTLGRL